VRHQARIWEQVGLGDCFIIFIFIFIFISIHTAAGNRRGRARPSRLVRGCAHASVHERPGVTDLVGAQAHRIGDGVA